MRLKETFDVGSMIKLNQEQIKRCGHDSRWTRTEEVYTISKILRFSGDDHMLIELDRNLPDNSKIINTFYLRLLTLKEIRRQKLIEINENR